MFITFMCYMKREMPKILNANSFETFLVLPSNVHVFITMGKNYWSVVYGERKSGSKRFNESTVISEI